MSHRLTLSIFTGTARGLFLVGGQLQRAESLLGAMALNGLDVLTLRDLTAGIYGAKGGYREDGLFDWEQRWFDDDLPSPPTRILVGAAGTGRELRYLAKPGCELVAFDPVPGFVDRARKIVPDGSCLAILQGAYEDLAEPTSDETARFAGQIEGFAPYDAVLLGWGSLTHVVTSRHRSALLKKLARLCPAGPVLTSFWMRGEQELPPEGRAARLGRRLGELIGSRDHTRDPVAPGDGVHSHCGFAHSFTAAEIRDLARAPIK